MGFSTARFTKAVDPNIICGICGGVLDTPMLTPCGHTFCETCICTWLDTATFSSCPECRTSMDKESVTPILSLRNFISSMEVMCPNKSHGCDEIMNLESQEKHLSVCAHAMVVCTTCQRNVSNSRLAEHRMHCVAALNTSLDKVEDEEMNPEEFYVTSEDKVNDSNNPNDNSLSTQFASMSAYTSSSLRLFTRSTAFSRLNEGSAHISYLLQRIKLLENQVARLLDDIHEAHRKNSFLYFENRQLKNNEFERHSLIHSNSNVAASVLSYPGEPKSDFDLEDGRSFPSLPVNDIRLGMPIGYEITCQQDIAKLSLHIARYLLQKPSGVDRDRVFNAIRKCYQIQFCPSGEMFTKVDHDIHMLLATAYSSNWFSQSQRILLGCWLQCTLKGQA